MEVEGTLTPFRGLNLGGTFAYTDAKYDRDVAYDPRSCDPTAVALTGFCPFNKFGFTPKVQFSLSADYTLPLDPDVGKITFGAHYYHQSRIEHGDTSTLNPFKSERPYGLLDLNVTWGNMLGRALDLSAFITNVTNRLYRVGSDDLSQSSNIGVAADIYGEPRMFGVGLTYRFGG